MSAAQIHVKIVVFVKMDRIIMSARANQAGMASTVKFVSNPKNQGLEKCLYPRKLVNFPAISYVFYV